ncbi:MAG TPA: hypothetical protein VHO25_00600 [Polyangiaceae bacterium]|nr:hypothetical protein [Polyangiaceae bacterium]
MRVLIAGCGYVGMALGSRLCTLGHQVWGLRRNPTELGHGIYGPGRRRLIDSVLSGSASYDPNRLSFTNRIHRDDVAGALAHLIDLPKPDAIYLGVDNLPASREEVLTWLAARLGAPEPKKQPANEPDNEAGSKRCSNARLLASGYRFSYPTFRVQARRIRRRVRANSTVNQA